MINFINQAYIQFWFLHTRVKINKTNSNNISIGCLRTRDKEKTLGVNCNTNLAAGSIFSFTSTRSLADNCLQRSFRENMYGDSVCDNATKSMSAIVLFLRASSSCRDHRQMKSTRVDKIIFIVEFQMIVLPLKCFQLFALLQEDDLHQ